MIVVAVTISPIRVLPMPKARDRGTAIDPMVPVSAPCSPSTAASSTTTRSRARPPTWAPAQSAAPVLPRPPPVIDRPSSSMTAGERLTS